MKKILIIGNGFDIAHELPTKYGEFLEFLMVFYSLYDTYRLQGRNLSDEEFETVQHVKLHKKLIPILHDLFVRGKFAFSTSDEIEVNDSILEELYNLINDNIWYEYFSSLYEKNKLKGLNWIDFESEMSDIIQWIDGFNFKLEEDMNVVSNVLYAKTSDEKRAEFYALITSLCVADYYEAFIEELFSGLQIFISALDIYLTYIIEKLPIAKKDNISDIKPDYVISFNYTHTFNKLYDPNTPVCYIHGECGCNNATNMVLGIDEYLDGGNRDENTNMSIFKKFIQRIRNRNDIVYKLWIDSWNKQYEEYHEREKIVINPPSKPHFKVYVYGHSLGATDKDLLYDYLYPEYTELIIYAYGKSEEGKLISRLIKIIGEDRLIEKSNCHPRKLLFEDCSN